jgi:hypothetical protein
MTVIINTHEELEALIDKDSNIIIHGDLIITCYIDIAATIEAKNIKANDITAKNIKASDIKADNIRAKNIKASDIKANNIRANDIKASDIKAYNIEVYDIKANDIKAHNIEASDIEADDINYHASCIAYKSLKCKTIEGRRKNAVHLCLDRPIEYI